MLRSESSFPDSNLNMAVVLFLSLFVFGFEDILANTELTVMTTKGPIIGKALTTFNGKAVSAFLGVPFAKPPVGDLRFKAPVEPDAWTQPIATDTIPIACTQAAQQQTPLTDNDWWLISNNETSEDCLYLNVWAPSPRPQNAAVMVWIHGGGYELGSSNIQLFDGKVLAAEQNIIVVSMNYRLAIFGHLYLDSEIDGNAALKDQALALKWVQDNIAKFGGNFENVTLFGISAGGSSAAFHLILPTSQQLFRRVIPMSGSNTGPWAYASKQVALKKYKDLAYFAGCKTNDTNEILNCFKAIGALKLVDLVLTAPKTTLLSFSPVIDGVYLPKTPVEMMLSGYIGKNKDVMIGETSNEGGRIAILLNALPKTEDAAPTKEQFSGLVKGVTGGNELLAKLIEYEYTNWTDPTNPLNIRQQIMNYISDSFFVCSLNLVADLTAANGNRVYQYQFSHMYSKNTLPTWVGASHGDNQHFFFGWPLDSSNGFTPQEAILSKEVMDSFGNFAKTGNPNSNGPEKEMWPAYTLKDKAYLDVNIVSKVKYHKRARKCAFWNQLTPDLVQTLGKLQASRQC